MKFDDLDKKMRVYETAHDVCVLPDMYIVARIDGRGFTKLTKETLELDAPFDSRFRDAMVATVQHLMESGFKVIYGYTQSDEISLLFDLGDASFGRKHRKINSILAGEASAKFSLLMNTLATFDCRVCEFPNEQLVIDYFRWRHEDAHRNALNAHCYWMLRGQNKTKNEATKQIEKLTAAQKNELLFDGGINFNTLPNWQKRGTGLYWEEFEKEGYNPKTKDKVVSIKKRIKVDFELPMKDDYNKFIGSILTAQK